MRGNNCHYVGDFETNDPIQAMENRILNIKRFQKEMPPICELGTNCCYNFFMLDLYK